MYEAHDRSLNKSVAVKIFDKRMLKDKSKRKEVQDELNIVSKLDHPNIIKLLRVVEDIDKVYIVMDNWGKNSLEHTVSQGVIDKTKAAKLFSQLVDAVQYLHSRNVFHRDIKLTNIMHKEDKICLLDFGLSTSSNYVREFLYCGTPTYMAPEMLSKNGYEGSQIDVWCIGVCIFKCLTGKYPFGGNHPSNLDYNEPNLKANISGGKFFEGLLKSKSMLDFFRKVFAVNPSSRMLLADMMSHAVWNE